MLSPLIPFSIYWFLYDYFVIFVLHFIFSKLFVKRGNGAFFAFSIVLFVLNPILPNVWILKNLSYYTIFYALGMYVYSFVSRHIDLLHKSWILAVNALLFILMCVILIKFIQQTQAFWHLYFSLFMALIGSFLFLLVALNFSKSEGKLKAFVSYLGKNSMEVYVVHLLPLAATRILLINHFHIMNLWLVALITTLISMIVCILVLEFSKKLHIKKWLF